MEIIFTITCVLGLIVFFKMVYEIVQANKQHSISNMLDENFDSIKQLPPDDHHLKWVSGEGDNPDGKKTWPDY
jgi:hypothetical protein